jgi:uncharacterized membrane protein YfcA
MNGHVAKIALLVLLIAVALPFVVAWVRDLRRRWGPDRAAAGLPSLIELGIGFVTNFFDTLGIGSFAPTTAAFRFRGVVADPLIPGTLNVGHYAASLAEALIFITIVDVDALTLWSMIGAAVLGAWLGAGAVIRASRRTVQIGMGTALAIASLLMLLRQLDVLPRGGDALTLPLPQLVLAFLANFLFGALMNLGIGLFAPCMITVALLGMNPKAAFPIMMGSCAFLQPVAGLRFIANARYAPRAALGLTLGGVPAVLIAAFIVKELPLDTLRWLVFAIALYTAGGLLRSALITRAEDPKPL